MSGAIASTASRAEALFLSALQPSDQPSRDDVEFAIWWAQRSHGGECRCSADFAAEYGEHPETAADRMRWALAVAA